MKIMDYAIVAFVYMSGKILLLQSEKNCNIAKEFDQVISTYKTSVIQNDPYYTCCNASLDMLDWAAVNHAKKTKDEKENLDYYLEWAAIGAAAGILVHDIWGNKNEALVTEEKQSTVYAKQLKNYYLPLFKPEVKSNFGQVSVTLMEPDLKSIRDTNCR